jgi:class 3 adenylate cyclase
VLPVLAGEVPGLTDPLGLGKADLMQALRWYFGRVDQALALHGGALQGIGHGSWFAHFSSGPDRVLWAVQTMYQMLLGLREEASEKGEAMPPTGLGVHLGPVVSGALPAGEALAPFSVGSGMRTASRLASMSIKLRCGILVSQAMVDSLEDPDRFDLRHLGKLRPAPGESRLDVFELFSVREEQVLAPMRTLQGVWDEALKEYRLGRWNKAAGGFDRYIARLPHDRPARYMLRQCRQRERA